LYPLRQRKRGGAAWGKEVIFLLVAKGHKLRGVGLSEPR